MERLDAVYEFALTVMRLSSHCNRVEYWIVALGTFRIHYLFTSCCTKSWRSGWNGEPYLKTPTISYYDFFSSSFDLLGPDRHLVSPEAIWQHFSL